MDDIDLGKALTQGKKQVINLNTLNTTNTIPINNTTTIYGIATGFSTEYIQQTSLDGWDENAIYYILVDDEYVLPEEQPTDEEFDEDPSLFYILSTGEVEVIVDDFEPFRLPTTVAVSEGDEVIINVVNKSPTVTGVVGWGDMVSSDILSAQHASELATQYASDALTAADNAQSSADEAYTAAQSALSDAEAAQTSANAAATAASAAQTTANEASTAASSAQTSANAAAAAASAAQTTANAASTAASSAQTSANAASTAASEASQAAYNAGRAASAAQAAAEAAQGDIDEQKTYFWHDDEGAHILSAVDGSQTNINSDGMEIIRLGLEGDQEIPYQMLASFTSEGIYFDDSVNARIGNANSYIFWDATNETLTIDSSVINIGGSLVATEDSVSELESEVTDISAAASTALSNTETLADGLQNEVNDRKSVINFVDGVLLISNPDVSNTFMKLESNKLAFVQGTDEVAYISDNKLYIATAQMTNKMQLGDIDVENPVNNEPLWEWITRSNGNLSLKWIGGNN